MKLLIVFYALFMLGYMVIKATGVGQPYRGAVKAVLSTTFLAVGVYFAATNGWKVYDLLVVVALLFAWIGDALLVFKHKPNLFHAGCIAFAFANVFLTAHSVLVYKWVWWSILLFAVYITAVLLCQKFGVFSFGKSTLYLNLYSVAVGYNGLLGLAVAITTNSTAALLFGLGSVLFLASDIVLGLFMFKIKKWQMDAFNTLLYFSGLMLIALSLMY